MTGDPAAAWAEIPLSDIVEINPKERIAKGALAPYVDMAALPTRDRRVTEIGAREAKGGARFRDGDTLVARITPCLENGKTAQMDGLGPGVCGVGSTEFIVLRAREEVVLPDFVYFLARDPYFRSFAIQRMTGTTGRQRVSGDALGDFIVALPPPADQASIVDVLGTLEAKIELNRRMAIEAERLARLLFRARFVDFDLSTGEGEARSEMEGVAVAEEAMALGPIPAGWTIGTIGDLCELVREGVELTVDNECDPYLGLDVMPRGSTTLWEMSRRGDVSGTTSGFRTGDVLFGKLRPYFKKVGVAPVDGSCSTEILVLRPRTPAHFSLLIGHASSQAFIDYCDRRSSGTRMPRAEWKSVRNYPVAIPPTAVLESLDSEIRPLFELNVGLAKETNQLRAIRDALLPELLSGAVRAGRNGGEPSVA